MVTVSKVVVEREKALGLLGFVGFKYSSRWDNERIAKKLLQIKDVLPDGEKPTDESVAETLVEVLAGIEDGCEFSVTSDVGEKAAGSQDVGSGSSVGGGVAEVPVKKARSEPAGPKGVRVAVTREYIAAKVIKKHGLSKGITREIVEEIDSLCAKKNEDSSWGAATRAWHALNGFTGEFPVGLDGESSPVASALDV